MPRLLDQLEPRLPDPCSRLMPFCHRLFTREIGAMQIKKHDRSHLVELRDGSAWRIWPGDIPRTLQWLPTTEIDVADIDDEVCSHARSEEHTSELQSLRHLVCRLLLE